MPQTEDEWQLLEDLHIVTRLANQEGVSKARIASLLAFMASAAAQQAAFEGMPQSGSQALREQMGDEHQAAGGPICPHCQVELKKLGGELGNPQCPNCGEVIEDVDIINEVLSE